MARDSVVCVLPDLSFRDPTQPSPIPPLASIGARTVNSTLGPQHSNSRWTTAQQLTFMAATAEVAIRMLCILADTQD